MIKKYLPMFAVALVAIAAANKIQPLNRIVR